MKNIPVRLAIVVAFLAAGFVLALVVNGNGRSEDDRGSPELATLRQEVQDLQYALIEARSRLAEPSPTLVGRNPTDEPGVRQDAKDAAASPTSRAPEPGFLDAVEWRVIQSSFELAAHRSQNMSEEEKKAYSDRQMVIGMQAMAELMKVIERYGLDVRRPDMKGEGALLTRMVRLALPKSRPDLTEEESRAIQDAASRYSEEQKRVAGLTEDTLVMREATLKRANLVQLRALISALAEDADLSVVGLVLTDLEHSANYEIHASRAEAQAAVLAALAGGLGLDDGQRDAVAGLVGVYLDQLADVPGTLQAAYTQEIVNNHYAPSIKSPYAYHPGGEVRLPSDWPEDRKRQGLLLHVSAQSAFLDAEAQFHGEMRAVLSFEQWGTLSKREYEYVVVKTDHPGAR